MVDRIRSLTALLGGVPRAHPAWPAKDIGNADLIPAPANAYPQAPPAGTTAVEFTPDR